MDMKITKEEISKLNKKEIIEYIKKLTITPIDLSIDKYKHMDECGRISKMCAIKRVSTEGLLYETKENNKIYSSSFRKFNDLGICFLEDLLFEIITIEKKRIV